MKQAPQIIITEQRHNELLAYEKAIKQNDVVVLVDCENNTKYHVQTKMQVVKMASENASYWKQKADTETRTRNFAEEVLKSRNRQINELETSRELNARKIGELRETQDEMRKEIVKQLEYSSQFKGIAEMGFFKLLWWWFKGKLPRPVVDEKFTQKLKVTAMPPLESPCDFAMCDTSVRPSDIQNESKRYDEHGRRKVGPNEYAHLKPEYKLIVKNNR